MPHQSLSDSTATPDNTLRRAAFRGRCALRRQMFPGARPTIPFIKIRWLAILLSLLAASTLAAADLPTVTVEHLYYLQSRADRVRKFKPEEMIAYCIAQKIGGAGFEYLYSQLFNIRVEIAKLVVVGEAESTDSRVVALNKTNEAYTKILQEEAQRVQYGIILEGQIASDTLQAITRAQSNR